jgi:trigger factor
MQISLTTTSGLERRMEVAVPVQRVDGEIQQRLKHLSRTARLKGFRPGKAPLTVIQKQFGEQVRMEVVSELMRTTFVEALTQQKLKPAAGPRLQPLSVEKGTDLKYAAVFEVLPDIVLKPVEGMKLEKPIAQITEQDIATMVESMRQQRPVFTEVARAAQDTDQITIDYHMHADDGHECAEKHGQHASFIVGAGQVVPEINSAVLGLTAGDTKALDIELPAPANAAETPPQEKRKAHMHFTVEKVEAQSLPQVDADFIRSFGIADGELTSLHNEVRDSMQREAESLSRDRLRTQITDILCRDNPIDLPRALIDEQVQQLQLELGRRMGARDVSQLPARETLEEPAKRRVTVGLLLGSLINSAKLQLDANRVNARVDEMAAAYPNAEEVRRNARQNAQMMERIHSSVLEEQAFDWIIERATVTEKTLSFSELTGFKQSASGQTS